MKNLKIMSLVVTAVFISQVTLTTIDKPIFVIPDKAHENHFKIIKKQLKKR
ncbi:MAG: hypothetical protein PHI05_02315 [Bacilli bacterium]|nr:hypothetical protein [Bacilli bacterium]MDD4547560.1 hypothetical protein [Bacilli bacterium]